MNSGVWNKLKQNVWRIVCVLLVCVLLTSHFSFNYAAKFVNGVFGEDTARVAKFDVTADCVYNEAQQAYVITIRNNSEVLISYEFASSSASSGVTIPDGENILAPGETRTHTLALKENYTQIHEDIAVDILRIQQVD